MEARTIMSLDTFVTPSYSFLDRNLNFVCKGPSGIYIKQDGPYNNDYSGYYIQSMGVYYNNVQSNSFSYIPADSIGNIDFFSMCIDGSGIPYLAGSKDNQIKIIQIPSGSSQILYSFSGHYGNLFFNGILNPETGIRDVYCFYSNETKSLFYRKFSESFSIERNFVFTQKNVKELKDAGQLKNPPRSLFLMGRYDDNEYFGLRTLAFDSYLNQVGTDYENPFDVLAFDENDFSFYGYIGEPLDLTVSFLLNDSSSTDYSEIENLNFNFFENFLVNFGDDLENQLEINPDFFEIYD